MSDRRLREFERAAAANPLDQDARQRLVDEARRIGHGSPCKLLDHDLGPYTRPFALGNRGELEAWSMLHAIEQANSRRIVTTRSCRRCEFLVEILELHPPLLIPEGVPEFGRWGKPVKVPGHWEVDGPDLKATLDVEQHDRLAEFRGYKMPDHPKNELPRRDR